jgi:cytochrome c553
MTCKRSPLIALGLLLAACFAPGADVDFERDVAPILEQRCLRCHNDEVKKAGLSLATREAALRGGENGAAFSPGKPGDSLILEMVGGKEPAMPKQAEPLTAEQVELLTRWIAAGANWPKERTLQERAPRNESWWSLQPVKRPPLPEVKDKAWPRNAIDHFILARLEQSGLKPSPEADRRTLLRRLSFDLWGLPTTPAEVAAFTDSSQYEQLIDSRLTSIHFGERYAQHWLDVVRFAETNGFEMNQERPNAWPYRDYVIRAFQNDLPYDRFIQEQLAGDKLGVDEATGFLVAGPWDQVKSPDAVLTANQRADELHDIVATVGSSLLGLTTGCARCHDHKFDPIPQTEYYALKAIFEGVQHGERELKASETPDREKRRAELSEQRRMLQGKLRRFEPIADSKRMAQRAPVTRGTNVDRFEPVEARFLRFTISESSQGEPCLDELEVFTAEDAPRNVALASAEAKATASGTLPGFAIHRLENIHDGKFGNEFSWISNEAGRGWVQLELPEKTKIDAVVWGRDQSATPRFDDRLATRYRIETSVDGEAWQLVASSDDRLPRGAPIPAKTETGEELAGLRSKLARIDEQISAASRSPMIYGGKMSPPGATHRLHRGDPTQPREEVAPGALSALKVKLDLPATSSEQDRRQALANWITSKDNPLTARVIVNRLWQWHFGQGLVDTPGDFGVNGARPSQPELLDYLAVELMDNGWSLRHIHRLIVTSATYRQTSGANAVGAAKDAATRLLWRYPARRLEAEPLRDAMLAVSGQLDLAPGGPGFSPFEPNANYVRVYAPKTKFAAADFRRMVYMTKVRMHVDPTFGVFDCPDGGQVAPKRSRSTTPLQALNLLNSAFVLDQARAMAERLKREAGDDVADQIKLGFQIAYQREPSADELNACEQALREQELLVFCRVLLNSNEFLFIE